MNGVLFDIGRFAVAIGVIGVAIYLFTVLINEISDFSNKGG